MAQSNEDIKWLYGKLKANGCDVGTEQEFTATLSNKEDRDWYYQKAKDMGLNMGSKDDFESLYAPMATPATQAQAAPAATALASQQQSTSAPVAETPTPTPQASQAPTRPAQERWQPSGQDKIRMSYQLNTMLNDFNQRSKARIEQTRRMTERFTPEGRRKLKAKKFQAQLAGTPTQVMGLTPSAQVSAPDASQGSAEGGTQQRLVQSGQSPVSYGVEYVDGKPVTEWLLPDGSLTTDLIEADQAEYNARTLRLRHEFVDRMKQNGLDPAKQEDVQEQAQLDMVSTITAPFRRERVAETLWQEAEEGHKADRNANADCEWSSYAAMGGGREMRAVTSSMNRQADKVSQMTRFDLQKMMDNAWARVGDQMTDNCYNVLRQANPEASEQELRQTASEWARQLSDKQIYDYAVERNAPKSALEYFGRTIADMNVINSVGTALARSQAGASGDLAAYEQAMGEYGKDHRVAQVGGTVLGMAIDPVTWVSGGVGSMAGKGALNIGGRFIANRAAGMSVQAGSRLFGSSLTGRIIVGSAGAAGNLATYEGLKESENQLKHGGYINPETGENEGYSVGEMLKSTGHGAIMGTVIGPLSPVIGNVADKAVKAMSSTAGKVAVRGGEVAVSSLAEGTIFSVPQWISGEGDAFDVWTDNMAMMLGFKAQHGIKSAPRVIAGLRPIKPTDGRPLTQAERNHNRMDFEERLRRNLDASPNDLSFTADEREELRRAGYGELADLFSADAERQAENSRDRAQPAQERAIDPAEGAIELRAERVEAETIHSRPKIDGYSAMEELMQDGRVSEAARAKAYYVLTGRMLPMSTVTGYNSTTAEDGRVIVNATNANGDVVTSRRFADKEKAQGEIDNIMRQAELNSVDVGERYAEANADNIVLSAAVNEVSPGADPESVKRIYRAVKAGNKDVTAEQVQLAEFIDDAIARNKDIADAHRPEAIRNTILEETGIDVDAALRKYPAKRTEAEKEAVKTYLERLFPEEARRKAEEPTPEQAEAQSQYEQGCMLYGRFEEGDPTAQADADAIALRMQEAYQGVEDAFGAESEYYMFHLNENPWGLLDDPELTIEQQDAVLYYINAKAALDGVMDASNEAADRKRAEVEQAVEKRTHKDNGVIIPATMKVDDRQVYVVKGDVVMFPDGTGVDARNSSEHVVVMDAQSGEYEFTSPDQILNISEAVDPQEELRAAHEVIEQEQMSMFGGRENPAEEAAEVEEEPTGNNPDENIPVEGNNGEENIAVNSDSELTVPAPNVEEYDRGYSDAIEEAENLTDERLATYVDTMREGAQKQMQEQSGKPIIEGENVSETDANVENGQETALSRIPLHPETNEPMFEAVEKETAWDGLVEAVGGESDAADIATAQVQQASTDLEALKKKPPTPTAPKLKGSPMAMAQAKREAAEKYQSELARYNQQLAEAQARLDAWNAILGVHTSRDAELRRQREEERRQRDAEAHDAAVAQFEEQQRIKAEKQAEAERLGSHNVHPRIKEKWNNTPKIEGNPDAITLPDGSTIRGRYVLTEAGAASASHDVNNAYEPTEGFPVDTRGQSVNDRDYLRDKDAQRIVEQMAGAYDNRALQTPVIVSRDGVVLSGNNRTMSGDLAARHGTDKAYVDYLHEFGQKYGFTTEQVAGMKTPRLVFVPDEALPYDATTFSRFNAQEMKSQSKPEAAVKLGKIVPDNVFNSIVGDIARYDRLSDYYADEKAVANALGALMQAGVINNKQMPEMRTGTALSAAGKELIENTLIGKVFQTSPDAVRQIISTPTMRQSIVMGLNEIASNKSLGQLKGANNRMLSYDLSEELSNAVDLVTRAKAAMPDVYIDGMPVSPFGRMQGLFDDEFGDSRVTDATTLLLADLLNSGRPSDLRKVLATYNNEASQSASGQADIFTGEVPTKGNILTTVNEHFRNATPREQQALVDAAIAERKRRAEGASCTGEPSEQRGGDQTSEQTPNVDECNAERSEPVAEERTDLEPLGKDRNDINEDTPEEAALRARISVGDEWEEAGPDEAHPIYKRKLYVDGKHEIIQTDAPDDKGSYTGSQLTYNGKDYGDLASIAQAIDTASAEPTEAQKAAGNYKMEHRRIDGYNISIENPKGSVRRGKNADGTEWETEMHHDYGYIRGTEGVDGDHIDVFLSDTPEEGDVFVIDQRNADGSFDEHKVMYGFPSEEAAREAYLSNYEAGWTGLGAITHVSKDEFKRWVQSSKRKTKPFSEYKSVTPIRYDSQGNPIDENGNLIIEGVKSIAGITDADFTEPTRTVGLPTLPRIVQQVLSTNGKQVIIKKNIFERNTLRHNELTPEISRAILSEALYNPTLYGKNKPLSRPNNWIVINVPDGKGNNKLVVLEVNEGKDNVEIVHWHEADNRGLEKIKRQAEREDGQLLILPSVTSEEAGALSGPTFDMPSDNKGNTLSGNKQTDAAKRPEPYTITPATYTNKAGRTTNVHQIKFNTALTYEQRKALANFAREKTDGRKTRGWCSDKETFSEWLFRTEEDARKAGELVGDEEAVADAQPLSHEDLVMAVAEAPGLDKKRLKNTPVNRVNLEDLAESLRRNGEAELSDYAEPVKTEPDTQHEISDDEMQSLANELRDLLGIGEDEGDSTLKFRDPGELTPQERQRIQSAGIRLAMGLVERGTTSFPDYATKMVGLLGDKIRPWLKSFYEGARWTPGYENYAFTPSEEVARFDVQNFDKKQADPIAQAAMIVEERKASAVSELAQKELTEIRNNNRKKQDEQTAADTAALASKDPSRAGRQSSADAPKKEDIFKEAARVAKEAQEKKKKPANKETAVKPEQPVGDLFGGQFDEPISDEKKTDVQPRPGTAERAGGHEPQPNEPLGESQRYEVKRTDGGGMGGRDSGHPVSDGKRGTGVSEQPASKRPLEGFAEAQHKNKKGEPAERLPEGERKNVRNNHAERGVDYAPKSEDARIKANIEAIELAKRMLDAGEAATPEQMAVLRRFSGWGGLGKAFNDSGYNPTAKRLRELLGEQGYQDAVGSRRSAYYTPANVIDIMWDIARSLGFKGGNILEGSAGIGNILGLMPSDISDRSNIHAVEIDSTTGGILSLLYPDAQVEIQGFQKTKVRNNSVDLAITNVPFITGAKVFDETGDKDLSKKFHDIHDFCIAKNIRKLREGGLGIFITSSGTMDNSKELRRWIISDGNADVIGAFRMHNKTFGGTGATSDIIVVRKRVNGKPSANAIDVTDITAVRVADYDTGETRKIKGQKVPVIKQYSMTYNKYFAEHPENMAGVMQFNFERGETRFPTSRALFPSADKPQEKMLSDWASRFADMEEDMSSLRSDQDVEEAVTRINEKLGDGVKEGSMMLNSEGEICMARMGEAVPLGLNKNKVKGHTKAECFKAYSAIKKALADVLEYQSTNEDDAGLEPLLKELNRAFDTFTRTYGNLHKNTAISFLRNDVDFSGILALETYSERGDKKGNKVVKVGKTDIFSRRVIETEKEPQPTTVKDGILASLYKSGGIDVDYISQALGKSTEEVKQEIVNSGLGFENPSTGAMEVSYQYLSGNVREKLHIAQENNEDGRYDANISALEKVMPMTIPAHLIEFSLGSSWIEPKLYEDFVEVKTGIRVKLTNVGGTWFMKTPWSTLNEKNRSMSVTSKLCDKTIMGHELIEAAITNTQITVSKTTKKWDSTTETITDKAATAECSTKIDEIRAEFKDWAREHMQADPEMSARIEQTYNEQFNNYVPMSIPNEFVPKHFGGQVTELHGRPFALRAHQGRAVVRGTTEPILLAHEVGTGKTYTLITTAMEMRRLGTARKPMIVVQNATVGQFVESAKEIYPNAKVLTIEEADRTAEGRKNFYAKIKYNDWDMIVVPQSVFERIPDSEERELAYIQDVIEEKMKALEVMREADEDGRSAIVRQAEKELELRQEELAALTEAIEGKRKKRDEKKEATTRQNAEVRAMEMLDREVDDVENFDDMGIDAILVDEAHEYKHLGFSTAMQRGVKGVDPSYSKKSQGVYLKTQAVMEHNHGRNVVFATGTPISNTAAEIWTFMRYLMPADKMKAYDIYYFDDFVRNFGNLAQMVEFKTNGKFAEVNRFAGYVNLPELVRIWSGVADTVLTREAGGVSDKIPEMEGGKPTDIYLPQTRALRSVMKYVKSELERYEQMTGKEKKENSHIPLTMYGIAKAAAVDARLVVANAEDDPNSKTNATVRETLRSLKESAKYKGTVAIFSDNYQNKRSGFNLYEEIRNKLIAEGVPAEQIVIIKSGMTIKKKLDIFDKVNAGEIRVILGSTFTLGTGVNIQERLHTLIHVDAPNRPMDYTQRNGRALRQGNLHKDMGIPVRIIRFGVEDSLDVTAYQRLKTKGAIADSIMNGPKMMQNSMENRVLEEEEDSFGDMTAQLSGSEYAILKNQAEREVRNLTAKQKGHDIDQIYVHNQLPKVEGFIRGAERRIELETKNLEIIGKHWPDGSIKKITIGKLTFDAVGAMGDFFKEQNAKMNEAAEAIREGADNWTSRMTIDIDGLPFEVTTKVTCMVDNNGQGQIAFEPERNVTYSCEALDIKDRTVKGNRIKNVMEEIAERIVPGTESRELLSRGQQQLAHYSEDYRQLKERSGKEFPYKQQLAEAKERLARYEEAMRKELEEKEKKYAEMDKAVDAASDISLDDDSEDYPTSGDENKYRDGEEMTDGERLRAIRALEPIAVERNDMSRDELRKVYNNLPSVEKNGCEIEFYRSAFKKIYKDGGLFGQIVPVLDEVLEQSVFAYSEKDNRGGLIRTDGTVHKGHDNVISFDNYVGKVTVNGKGCYVRTTVQRGFDGRNGTHSFFVTGVDVYENTADLDSSPGYPRATDANGNKSADGIVDAKLRQFFERASAEADKLDMRERVEELSEKLHTPIRIVSEESELSELTEDDKPRYSRRERRAKGWWSSEDDGVVVVLPNNVNVADVDNTVVHEVVGHKGLRALIGEERFEEFLGEVYAHASNPIRKVIDKMTDDMVAAEADRLRVRKSMAHERAGEDVNSHYYTDMAEARVEAEKKREQFRKESTEEYMSDLGGRIGSEGFEKMSRDELTLWGKIKAKVQQFLDKFLQGLKIVKSIRLTDKDLSYILYKSWKNLRKNGVFDDAEDIAMRRKTGWGESPLVEVSARDRESFMEEAVGDRIEALFDEAVSGKLTGKPVKVGALTAEGKAYLERLSGIKMKENISFVLNPSDLVHIHNRHFGDNEHDGRNIPLTKDDIRAIASIVSSPTRVIYAKEKIGTQRNLFFFLKDNGAGSYNLLEVYADRKGNLTSKSFFKSKEGVSQRVISLQNDPTLYVRDGWGNPLDDAKLLQNAGITSKKGRNDAK